MFARELRDTERDEETHSQQLVHQPRRQIPNKYLRHRAAPFYPAWHPKCTSLVRNQQQFTDRSEFVGFYSATSQSVSFDAVRFGSSVSFSPLLIRRIGIKVHDAANHRHA
jgi:hypothetical protein